jgi:hypothetical protein
MYDNFEIQSKKDYDAYKWLFLEMLLHVFNDILTNRWYRYYTINVIKYNCKVSKRKLKKHYEAIEWLMNGKDTLCFRILGLQELSESDIVKAISRKFNGSKKFNKILRQNFLKD